MASDAPRTLFVTLAGSHAHGTARESSDVDLRGVGVAPLPLRLSLFRSFEQTEGPLSGEIAEHVLPRLRRHPTASKSLDVKTECVLFDVAKFLGQCAVANPNALEILFADEEDWLYDTPAWRRLHEERRLFLTRKVQQTFLGYAMAQLKRIRSHRSWLFDPPKRKPSRKDFGLPETTALGREDRDRIEQELAAKIRDYRVDDLDMPKGTRIALRERLLDFYLDVLAAPEEELDERLRAVATHALRLPSEVVHALNAEKRYRAALNHWRSYETWKADRNPVRAELERKHGYDTKHAMHLIRLMRTGLEILRDGELRVRRPDADELIAVRDGALDFDELLAETERLKAEVSSVAQRCQLPADVDRGRVDALAYEVMTLEVALSA